MKWILLSTNEAIKINAIEHCTDKKQLKPQNPSKNREEIEAQYLLGKAYLIGKNIGKNEDRAKEVLKKSAEMDTPTLTFSTQPLTD